MQLLIARKGADFCTTIPRFLLLIQLKEWDLWGPLLVCLTLSIMLSSTAPANQGALVFASVFVVVWCGAAMVTLNAQLLGGGISFFQSVCVLGYCVFPLTVASAVCLIVSAFHAPFFVKAIIVVVGFLWSTRGEFTSVSRCVCKGMQYTASARTSCSHSLKVQLHIVERNAAVQLDSEDILFQHSFSYSPRIAILYKQYTWSDSTVAFVCTMYICMLFTSNSVSGVHQADHIP
jgi:protein YIPF6